MPCYSSMEKGGMDLTSYTFRLPLPSYALLLFLLHGGMNPTSYTFSSCHLMPCNSFLTVDGGIYPKRVGVEKVGVENARVEKTVGSSW